MGACRRFLSRNSGGGEGPGDPVPVPQGHRLPQYLAGQATAGLVNDASLLRFQSLRPYPVAKLSCQHGQQNVLHCQGLGPRLFLHAAAA